MSEEQIADSGEIVITISDRIYLKTNMSPSETNLWIDRVKMMIASGDFDAVEQAE